MIFLFAIDVDDIINKMNSALKKYGGYIALFVETHKNKETKIYTGTLRVKFPDKFRMDYDQPAGQLICSDGAKLWVYLPSLKLVGEQDISRGEEFLGSAAVGLARMKGSYNIRYLGKESLGYRLVLRPKRAGAGFSKVEVWIDPNLWIVVKSVGYSPSGKKYILELRNIRTGVSLPDDVFVYRPVGDVQVLYNPFVPPGR